jgi:hypothetical protein
MGLEIWSFNPAQLLRRKLNLQFFFFKFEFFVTYYHYKYMQKLIYGISKTCKNSPVFYFDSPACTLLLGTPSQRLQLLKMEIEVF